jgi:DNA-directed RNA polymerase specialized sigma24 family protein
MDIQSALGRVTRIQREVFTAVCIEGKTQASVAFERGVTQAAVSQTLAAAKARLAELLEDYA